jgi:hypothetical protein
VDGAQQIDADWGMSAPENGASALPGAKKILEGGKIDEISGTRPKNSAI